MGDPMRSYPPSVSPERKRRFLAILERIDASGCAYFVCSGTMLGMCRHQGLIPWDDDADVSVRIEDFGKLVEFLRRNRDFEVSEICNGHAQVWLRGKDEEMCDVYAVAPHPSTLLWAFAAPILPNGEPTFLYQAFYPQEVFEEDSLFPTQLYAFEHIRLQGPRNLHETCRKAYGQSCLEKACPPPLAILPHGSEVTRFAMSTSMALFLRAMELHSVCPHVLKGTIEATMLCVFATIISCFGLPIQKDSLSAGLSLFRDASLCLTETLGVKPQ